MCLESIEDDVYQRLIPVPDITTQQQLITEMAILETNIIAAQKIIDEAGARKQAVLKRYL